ncbi:MAG: ParB/RepB/Spo0J family partition protein [Phycisphaerales bacterium]
MSFAAANRARKHTKPAAAKATEPQAEAPPILGVDLKGELLDVELAKIIDPKLPSDRLERDGDDERVRHLAKSMSEVGQLQPVMLERLVDGRFARVFGRRRVSAARILKWDTIRAVVVPPLPDDVRRTVVAVENVQRQDLTPAEETLAVSELLELQAVPAAVQYARPLAEHCGAWSNRTVTRECADDVHAMNAEQQRANRHDLLLDHRVRGIACELVAAMLAKPATWVRDRMYLLRLPDKARKLVLDGKLPLAHAREIAKLADEKRRAELAEDYAAGGDMSISDSEPGKLEELQEDVRRSVFALNVVQWKLEVPFAGKPPCMGCPHNSISSPGLFEHGGDVSKDMKAGRGTYASIDAAKASDAGVCTLPSCYETKLRSAKAAISAAAKKIVDRHTPKKGEPAAKPISVPEYVDPKALDKKVRDRKACSGGRTAASKVDPRAKARDAAAARKREAEGKLDAALEDRATKARKAIDAALAKIPGAALLLDLLLRTKAFEGMSNSYDRKKARRVASSPAVASAIRKLKKPTLQHFLAIEKEHRGRLDSISTWADRDNGFVDVLAKALGVDVEPAPTLDQFLAEAKAEQQEHAGDDADDAEDEE